MLAFPSPLKKATLIRRYKRFLADAQLPSGDLITLHCPNTGSMLGCALPGQPIWYSTSDNPKRKHPYTWELIQNEAGHFIGINTNWPNLLVHDAIVSGVLPQFSDYDVIRREVPYGVERSRIDLLLSKEDKQCYVEVKNVTLCEKDQGYFPDAVTARGIRHLRELMHIKAKGHRAVLIFCVQHTGIKSVASADHIDPQYGATLREANEKGVEILAFSTHLSVESLSLNPAPLPVKLKTCASLAPSL